MSQVTTSKPKPLEDATVVLDNGADLIKVGVVLESSKEKYGGAPWSSHCLTVPNFIAKSKTGKKRFISNQALNCHDTSGLFITRAFDRGYMCIYDVQKTIWDHIFGADALNLDPSQIDLLVTEPILNFAYVRDVMNEMLFEDFGFRSVCIIPAAQLAENNHFETTPVEGGSNTAGPSGPSPFCTLVVDSGFSFTHIIPFINGRMVNNAVKRINVGGKVLTNQLKEIVSYRQIHVLEETYLMNQVKEDVCFVSADFNVDMDQARLKWPHNKIYQEYVLPDFATHRRGYVRPEAETMKRTENGEQILKLNNERFSVPELLFNPSDIGLNQMGISELIHEVINSFPKDVRPHFYNNVLLIGGNTKFPGFQERVLKDVRAAAPDHLDVQVKLVEDPIEYACHGGNKLAYKGRLESLMVSKQSYQEGRMGEIVSLHD